MGQHDIQIISLKRSNLFWLRRPFQHLCDHVHMYIHVRAKYRKDNATPHIYATEQPHHINLVMCFLKNHHRQHISRRTREPPESSSSMITRRASTSSWSFLLSSSSRMFWDRSSSTVNWTPPSSSSFAFFSASTFAFRNAWIPLL